LQTHAQDVLVLEKPGKKTSFYYVSDHITLSLINSKEKISGKINAIGDSSFHVGYAGEIAYRDIRCIYMRRGLADFFTAVFLTASLTYFSLDAVNNLINSDRPVIRDESLLISLSGLAITGAFYLISEKKIKTADGEYRLKKIRKVNYTNP
jgi:hypothetical protein